MAKRPLYDLLPRNSEIHNFTSLKLTERQARVLGMGLKFRPSLLPPSEAQFDLQIQDFCRRVRLQVKGAVSRNSANLGYCKMLVKLKEI